MAKFELSDVVEWTEGIGCVPQALAAITGKTPVESASILAAVARRLGGAEVDDTPQQSFAPRHWFETLVDLGAQPEISLNLSDLAYGHRPSIANYVRTPWIEGLQLIVLSHTNSGTDGHVIAFDGRRLVDEYTRGQAKPVADLSVPPEFEPYRVKYIVSIRGGNSESSD